MLAELHLNPRDAAVAAQFCRKPVLPERTNWFTTVRV
jgi:hypothetical protein